MKSCTDHTPSWFVGDWRDWHRGHGCDQDDTKPRSERAVLEITQHAANAATGFLTDAELSFLRASTTSGDTLRVRALDELIARRAARVIQHALTDDELNFLRAATPTVDTKRIRALNELTTRRAAKLQVLEVAAICAIGEPPRADPKQVCAALDTWSGLLIKSQIARDTDKERTFAKAWREVRMAITKSCLLDRVLNHHEQPSQTPCPVHKGLWSGCHAGWPGQLWADGRPIEVEAQLQEWHDAGCRCHLHSCGCTTGWQPDEHCGCLKKAAP